MIRNRFFGRWAIPMTAILFLGLIPLRVLAAGAYVQHNLVSDIPLLADFTDPNLVNPWGIAISAASPFWLCDNHTGLSTVYSTAGGAFAVTTTVVTVPAPAGNTQPGACTGIVANAVQGFAVTPGNNANFIFATEDGTISGWNRTVDATHAIIKVDNSASGAVYKGLAMASNGSATFLYAANFHAGTIDIFDSNFAKTTLSGSFADPAVPANFAPFNIQNLGGKLYVTYAKPDSAKHDDVAGSGNGYVDVFDTNGNLLTHLISTGRLNSPWGVAIAPASFGAFANDLLVGNFGDGTINAFDPSTGALLGTLQNPSGNPIVNPGLWGLQFGNGGSGGLTNTLYFSAGISAGDGIENHGLFGNISVATTVGTPPVVNDGGVVNNASYTAGSTALAPGSIAAVFGSNLTDGTSCLPPSCNPTFRTDKRLNSTMAGAQVAINGIPVPIFYAAPTQLGIQIPNELTGTSATLQVTVGGQSSASKTISIGAFSPGIFSFTADGKGDGAITHADGTPVNTASPANPGETVIIYATGLGQVTPSLPTGEVPTVTVNNVSAATVAIDNIPAQVQFTGLSGCCVGLNQINVVVPSNVHAGTSVNVAVTVGGQPANVISLAIAAASPTTEPPPPLTLSSLTLSATSMTAGESYQGRVGVSAAASSDAVVALSSSNPSVVSVPASVTVPAGSNSAAFTLTTSLSVTTATTVTITASAGGVSQTAALTVTPAPPPPPYDPYY